MRKNFPPPDLQLLGERIRLLGDALTAARRDIEQAKAPFQPLGLWATGDGRTWSFHRRQRHELPRAS
ncbi:MAG: hypothetical protein IT304_10815 [Dehalococcoidia bacterium]|nr:hypothetical protein [Dehalococcoidia bacterium]